MNASDAMCWLQEPDSIRRCTQESLRKLLYLSLTPVWFRRHKTLTIYSTFFLTDWTYHASLHSTKRNFLWDNGSLLLSPRTTHSQEGVSSRDHIYSSGRMAYRENVHWSLSMLAQAGYPMPSTISSHGPHSSQVFSLPFNYKARFDCVLPQLIWCFSQGHGKYFLANYHLSGAVRRILKLSFSSAIYTLCHSFGYLQRDKSAWGFSLEIHAGFREEISYDSIFTTIWGLNSLTHLFLPQDLEWESWPMLLSHEDTKW